MLLKLKNIGKIYDSNGIFTIGIRGINLELDYNEFVTIEGESGSGKSTLLNVIGANDTYEEGELYFNGEETSHYSESDWERYRENNIATIFQDFNIIENLTVLENVELALLRIEDKKERRRRAKELIERVGLSKQINQRGSKLSGGEKQRTVIARALAKDSPVILADEPTGNLDVKASKEVASLLKELSKDKLVIVVTHNPEFFKEYATRRIRVFDGKISEDKLITKPKEREETEEKKEDRKVSKWLNLKNTFHIGALNYKSRPKFTLMMSFALFVCAITLFMVIAIFGQTLIKPIKTGIDGEKVQGKLLVSGNGDIDSDILDELVYKTGAGYFLIDNNLAQFQVSVSKQNDMLGNYEVICLYSPYEYNLREGKGVMIIPQSYAKDAEKLKEIFLKSQVGIEDIEVVKTLENDNVRLYLGYDTLNEYGKKIMSINSTIKIGEYEAEVFTFEISEELQAGQINLINSNYFNIIGKTAVFSAKADKSYIILDSSQTNEDIDGMVVQMSEEDYENMFAESFASSTQACLYFSSEEKAENAISLLPEGYMGLMATSEVYVQNAGEVFTENVLYYIALIGATLMFGILISIIFMRSIKIYQTDFAVYRTLGISGRVSSRSLYIQMAFIFLPTLVLLPLVSLVATLIPASTFEFISIGNYIFIEAMLLLIVELVAFGFNKGINGQSIRKSLKRGSK